MSSSIPGGAPDYREKGGYRVSDYEMGRHVIERGGLPMPDLHSAGVRTIERVFRIGVASALTLIFTAWSVHLFESQPSGVPTVQVPKCTTPPTQACLEHALKVAFSNPDGHWSLWVIWVFWSLIAVVWLTACSLILWTPRTKVRVRSTSVA